MHDGLLVILCAVLGLGVGWVLDLARGRTPRRTDGERPGLRCSSTVVRLGCAVLFGACAGRFGASAALPAYLLLVAALLAVSVVDLEQYRIPNRILVPTVLASVPLLALAALGEGGVSAFLRALAGGAAAFLALLALAFISPRGMGMGDVKLAFVLGLYLGFLGWGEVFLGLFLGFLFGAVVGLVLIATGLRGRKDFLPYGPFLAAGTVVAVLWGEPILRWYSA
jgi:leader peptidase (prepilin peptidase)/N-methyltransferase